MLRYASLRAFAYFVVLVLCSAVEATVKDPRYGMVSVVGTVDKFWGGGVCAVA